MGMYDTVTVINISNKEFRHNNVSYQTKDLDCQLSEYIIFNDQLWKQYDGEKEERYAKATPVNVSEELNIYTDYDCGDKTYWLEYDLSFTEGKLTDVKLVSEQITKDNSDKSNMRPAPKSKSCCITVDFQGVQDDVYELFHENIESNLDKLRDAVGDNKAEIAYQIRSKPGSLYFGLGSPRWIHSVVQSLSDFESTSSGKPTHQDSEGNTLTILLDEAHHLR